MLGLYGRLLTLWAGFSPPAPKQFDCAARQPITGTPFWPENSYDRLAPNSQELGRIENDSVQNVVKRKRFHWRSDNPKRQRGDAFAGKPVPALRICEKLPSGRPGRRNPKPSAPPSLVSKGLQTGWGRR